MASRTEQSREIPITKLPGDVAPASETPESLDKVRDILFGDRMRTVEARIQSLDERLRQDQESMRAKLERRIAELESIFRREMQAFDERLSSERQRRGDEFQMLADEVRDAIANVTSGYDRFEQAAGAMDAEVRDQLLQHRAAVAADIEQLSEWLASELQRQVLEIRADKLDVSAMAMVFSEMADRLGEAVRAPAKHDASE